MFGGYTKEPPVYLSDYWVLDLVKVCVCVCVCARARAFICVCY